MLLSNDPYDDMPVVAPETNGLGSSEKPLGERGEEKSQAGFFDGIGEAAYRGLVAGGLQTAENLMFGLQGFNTGDAYKALQDEEGKDFYNIDPKKWQEQADRAAEEKRQELKALRMKEYNIDPETMGAAAEVVYGFSGMLTKAVAATAALGPTGGAALFGADYGATTYSELRDEGVDKKTAAAIGGVSAVLGGIGVRIPATFGKSRLQSAIIGSMVNGGLTASELEATSFILANQNYDDLAAYYEINPINVGTSMLFGGAFGAMWRRPVNQMTGIPHTRYDAIYEDVLNHQNNVLRGITDLSEEARYKHARQNTTALLHLAAIGDIPPEKVISDFVPQIYYGADGKIEGTMSIVEKRLQAEEKLWASKIDGMQNKPTQPILMLTQTPLVMTLVGARFRELYANPHVFDGFFPKENIKNPDKNHYHPEMTRDVIKQIPRALTDPVAVFRSYDNTFVFFLELSDTKGTPVVTPVKFEATGLSAKINLIRSSYGKDGNIDNYFKKQDENHNILYVNREKLNRLSPTSGSNTLRDSNSGLISILNRLDPTSGSNRLRDPNNGLTPVKNIKTEKDLVKLRQQNPDLYQGKELGSAEGVDANSGYFVREGLKLNADDATIPVVKIEEGLAPEFKKMKDFANWAFDVLKQGGNITIRSSGQTVSFVRKGVKDSVKRARGKLHRSAYPALRDLIRNAEYDHSEHADVRHKNVQGQDVYYSALQMGDKTYSVRLKFDIVWPEEKLPPKQGEKQEDVRYKDHKLVEIEIAPTLYDAAPLEKGPHVQQAGANQKIAPSPNKTTSSHGGPHLRQDGATSPTGVKPVDKISLGILRGRVKPTSLADGILRQNYRGAYDSSTRSIHFTDNADFTTFSHEFGHFYLDSIMRFATEGASEESRAMAKQLLDAFGIKSLDEWNALGIEGKRKFHEQFASHFEEYVTSGKATQGWEGVIERFVYWLKSLFGDFEGMSHAREDYRAQIGEELPKLSKEVRQILDKLFDDGDMPKIPKDGPIARALGALSPETAAARTLWMRSAIKQKTDSILSKEGSTVDTINNEAKAYDALNKASEQMEEGIPVDVSKEMLGADIDLEAVNAKLEQFHEAALKTEDPPTVNPDATQQLKARVIERLDALELPQEVKARFTAEYDRIAPHAERMMRAVEENDSETISSTIAQAFDADESVIRQAVDNLLELRNRSIADDAARLGDTAMKYLEDGDLEAYLENALSGRERIVFNMLDANGNEVPMTFEEIKALNAREREEAAAMKRATAEAASCIIFNQGI